MTLKTIIGHYAILSELGRGGMGVVYKAFEPKLDRYVAIKELSSSLSHDPALVQRFLREAQAMAALNDPHIIQIHYIGQDDEQPYFAMEFVDGESLSSLLERVGKFTVTDSLKLLQQAAKGLASAHEHGVIHRDIKPSNLMLNKRDQLKIADFGIAQTQREASNKKLTATGDVVGTPGYLSPEVCLGNAVDARSDLFALGIVLFEMLSGRLPFEDISPLKLMLRVVEADVPDIRTLNQSVDENTVAILHRLLAKNPDHRYQSAHALLDDLNTHPALQTQAQLSIHACLPGGAASTVVSTPSLAKAAAKATQPTPIGLSAAPGSAPASDSFVLKKSYLWSALAILGFAGLGIFWWLKPADTVVPPTVLPATEVAAGNSQDIATTPSVTPASVPVQSTAVTPAAEAPSVPAAAAKPAVEISAPTIKTPIETKPVAIKPEPKPIPSEAMEKYGSVYLGAKNEQLSLAHAEGKEVAYLKITGINNPLDGKVIRATFRPAGYQGRDYVIDNKGGDYVMVVSRKMTDNSGMRTEVYVPGLDTLGLFTYDSELSKQLDTQQLRSDYKAK
jgi:eukaryotic-like serine/threonine-protein kinase